jgi:hypothetical protein
MGSKSTFTISLLIMALAASSLVSVQAYVVDSITKPSVPEFSVQLVSHPYDVPPKTTTTVDQYTGKETTTTIPGYRVENKSIEVKIKNPSFTPYTIIQHTGYNHDTDEIYNYTYDRNFTVNLFYNVNVKGHYGNEWKSVGGIASYPDGPQSNAQRDSEYTIISVKTEDFPNDAVLDFKVQAAVGYYVAWGRSVMIIGYDFYGQESDWSSIQQLTLGTPQTPIPAPTAPPTFIPTITPTIPPAATQPPTTNPEQPNGGIETNFAVSWEQAALVVCVAIIAALIVALVVSRRKKA